MPDQQNKYYIKERYNTYFGTYYYVRMGQLGKKYAMGYESPLYGNNIMLAYDTEEEYLVAIAELEKKGHLL